MDRDYYDDEFNFGETLEREPDSAEYVDEAKPEKPEPDKAFREKLDEGNETEADIK